MRESPLAELIRIHKALAHPARVRALAVLRGGELCVCQLNAVIAVAPSTLSAHLAELKDAGLVAERKAGRWVHYRLAAGGAAAAALAALWPALAADPQTAADSALLARITEHPAEALCRPGFDLAALRASCCPPAPPDGADCCPLPPEEIR
jgi:DNA-binding transcriptional ArsR family regulator